MGQSPREKPSRLAEKLAQIRYNLNLSQDGLIRQLGLEHRLMREDISKYERGIREPSLLTLLKYARAIGVSTDVLIDDALDLPTLREEVKSSLGQKRHQRYGETVKK